MFLKLTLGSLREVALKLLETWYGNSYKYEYFLTVLKNTQSMTVFLTPTSNKVKIRMCVCPYPFPMIRAVYTMNHITRDNDLNQNQFSTPNPLQQVLLPV